ncbi:MAG: hypothetical protein AAFV29_09985 [Myxococcota bacterium]
MIPTLLTILLTAPPGCNDAKWSEASRSCAEGVSASDCLGLAHSGIKEECFETAEEALLAAESKADAVEFGAIISREQGRLANAIVARSLRATGLVDVLSARSALMLFARALANARTAGIVDSFELPRLPKSEAIDDLLPCARIMERLPLRTRAQVANDLSHADLTRCTPTIIARRAGEALLLFEEPDKGRVDSRGQAELKVAELIFEVTKDRDALPAEYQSIALRLVARALARQPGLKIEDRAGFDVRQVSEFCRCARILSKLSKKKRIEAIEAFGDRLGSCAAPSPKPDPKRQAKRSSGAPPLKDLPSIQDTKRSDVSLTAWGHSALIAGAVTGGVGLAFGIRAGQVARDGAPREDVRTYSTPANISYAVAASAIAAAVLLYILDKGEAEK